MPLPNLCHHSIEVILSVAEREKLCPHGSMSADEEAHRGLRISPEEFDEVAAELGRTLDFFKVPNREKGELLTAFSAHKDEVTAGYVALKRS